MTRTIKLTIEYDGTQFNGWQIQTPRTPDPSLRTPSESRTVQGELEKALQKIFKQNILLTGSGRTDSGVHALGQVAHFKTRSTMPEEEMRNALNANLPEDISVREAVEAASGFHAQYSVKSKTYRYTIHNHSVRCAQQRYYALHISRPLDLRRMRAEAQCLIGRRDFKSFTASDPAKRKSGKRENTIRIIKRLNIRKKGDTILIDIEANGFLYKMVRNIVGTLLEIGLKKLEKGSMRKILAQKNRHAAGTTAKAKGLCLLEVRY